ncbi:hypothetical protein NQ315_016832 [Exocentrus adspersus]|uniref:Uncharacterized protein n=1 Tax=Exocentrus adspersus TaxID=1586481 RepID=A0AAV8VXR5_9CUCU|nr:hypothetical protein NQ315_016832 [Exocentrus adspersus]
MAQFIVLSSADFPNICRICLQGAEDLQRFKESNAADLYKLLTNIEVETGDMFPKNICKSCKTRLDDINAFIERCKYNETLFQTIYIYEQVNDFKEIEEVHVKTEPEDNFLPESVKREGNLQVSTSNIKFTPCLRCGGLMRHGSAYAHYRLNPKCRPDESKCPMCDKVFDKKQELFLHLNTHKKTRVRKCPQCSEQFNSAEYLSNHLKFAHPDVKLFLCTVCGKGFKGKNSLNKHTESSHAETQCFKILCEHCGKEFKNSASYGTHLHYSHSGRDEATPQLKKNCKEKRARLELECPTCERVFANRFTYAEHQLIHKGEKKLSCNICGKKFKTNTSLKVHVNSHSDRIAFQEKSFA